MTWSSPGDEQISEADVARSVARAFGAPTSEVVSEAEAGVNMSIARAFGSAPVETSADRDLLRDLRGVGLSEKAAAQAVGSFEARPGEGLDVAVHLAAAFDSSSRIDEAALSRLAGGSGQGGSRQLAELRPGFTPAQDARRARLRDRLLVAESRRFADPVFAAQLTDAHISAFEKQAIESGKTVGGFLAEVEHLVEHLEQRMVQS